MKKPPDYDSSSAAKQSGYRRYARIVAAKHGVEVPPWAEMKFDNDERSNEKLVKPGNFDQLSARAQHIQRDTARRSAQRLGVKIPDWAMWVRGKRREDTLEKPSYYDTLTEKQRISARRVTRLSARFQGVPVPPWAAVIPPAQRSRPSHGRALVQPPSYHTLTPRQQTNRRVKARAAAAKNNVPVPAWAEKIHGRKGNQIQPNSKPLSGSTYAGGEPTGGASGGPRDGASGGSQGGAYGGPQVDASGGPQGGASGGSQGGASGGSQGGASYGSQGGAYGGPQVDASGGPQGGAYGGSQGGASGGPQGGASGGPQGGAAAGFSLEAHMQDPMGGGPSVLYNLAQEHNPVVYGPSIVRPCANEVEMARRPIFQAVNPNEPNMDYKQPYSIPVAQELHRKAISDAAKKAIISMDSLLKNPNTRAEHELKYFSIKDKIDSSNMRGDSSHPTIGMRGVVAKEVIPKGTPLVYSGQPLPRGSLQAHANSLATSILGLQHISLRDALRSAQSQLSAYSWVAPSEGEAENGLDIYSYGAGNICAFVNHQDSSEKPNMEMMYLSTRDADELAAIAIVVYFARRNIAQDEQLLISYGSGYDFNSLQPHGKSATPIGSLPAGETPASWGEIPVKKEPSS
ncbi:MAG: SET domain-containing protein [Granulosicoccus sp.]